MEEEHYPVIIPTVGATVINLRIQIVVTDMDTYRQLDTFYHNKDNRRYGSGGMASTDKGKEIIYIPLPIEGNEQGWKLFDRIMGHELRHIICDQNPEIGLPDPDD